MAANLLMAFWRLLQSPHVDVHIEAAVSLRKLGA
jgi:hypothetical protein